MYPKSPQAPQRQVGWSGRAVAGLPVGFRGASVRGLLCSLIGAELAFLPCVDQDAGAAPLPTTPSKSARSSGAIQLTAAEGTAPAEKGSLISLWQETAVQLRRGQLACSGPEQWERRQMLLSPGWGAPSAAPADGGVSSSRRRKPGTHASSRGGLASQLTPEQHDQSKPESPVAALLR